MTSPTSSTDRILAAVAEGAAALLKSHRVEDALDAIVGLLCDSTDASRVYVHQIKPHPKTGEPLCTELASRAADGFTPADRVVDMPMRLVPGWLAPLERGEVVQGGVDDFDTPEAQTMRLHGTMCVLSVPILVDGRLAGFLGLDDCAETRTWSSGHVAALQTMAASLGAAWQTQAARDRLASREADYTAALREDAEVSAALAAYGRDLIENMGEPELPDRISRWTSELLEADAAYAILASDDSDTMEMVGSWGLSDEARELARAIRVPALLAMVNDAPWDMSHDATGTVGVSSEPSPAEGLGLPDRPRNRLSIRLKRGSTQIGLLILLRTETATPFSGREQRIAVDVGQITSLALENARLLKEHQQASLLKSEFVATMSHELRTPLGVILGYLELLLDGDFGPLADEQREVMERTARSGRELAGLVAATLDLSRIEAGRERVQTAPFDLAALLEEIRRFTAPARDEKGIDLEVRLSPQTRWIDSDQGKVDLILRNLVANAVKFNRRDGWVRVSAERDGDDTIIRVSDSGPGIPEADRSVIYEAFRQVPDANGQTSSGVGLGLHIAHRLLDLLGGSIDLERGDAPGATFAVRLPPPAQVIAALPAAPAARARGA